MGPSNPKKSRIQTNPSCLVSGKEREGGFLPKKLYHVKDVKGRNKNVTDFIPIGFSNWKCCGQQHKPPSAGFGKRHLHTVDGQNPPTSWDC